MSIRFCTSTLSLRDLIAPAGFGYRGAVAFPDGSARVCCFSLADIVRSGQGNCLQPLDCLKGRKGVYMVADGDRALYVGSSTTVSDTWDLSKRIAQHFRNDGGGTLRKNYTKHSGCDYEQFVRRMQGCRLQVISFGNAACNQQVLRLEHLLIGLLGPEYCDVFEPP